MTTSFSPTHQELIFMLKINTTLPNFTRIEHVMDVASDQSFTKTIFFSLRINTFRNSRLLLVTFLRFVCHKTFWINGKDFAYVIAFVFTAATKNNAVLVTFPFIFAGAVRVITTLAKFAPFLTDVTALICLTPNFVSSFEAFQRPLLNCTSGFKLLTFLRFPIVGTLPSEAITEVLVTATAEGAISKLSAAILVHLTFFQWIAALFGDGL